MLTPFDWLRTTRTGAELLAMLQILEDDVNAFGRLESVAGHDGIGPVPSALAMPCSRCWRYPRLPLSIFCAVCRVIRDGTLHTGGPVRDTLVLWGYVNRLPRHVANRANDPQRLLMGAYAPDESHFVAMIRRTNLQPWLQDLVLYHGAELRGHIQLFPTTGQERTLHMGDFLARVIGHEAYFPLDRLRIRFYTRHYHVLRPHELDKEGILTFDVSEFLSLLEMASIFRSLFSPADQQALQGLLTMPNPTEQRFYWGRFAGGLNQRNLDLLEAWQMRQWPAARVNFFYELLEHVDYRPLT